ncbi:phosphocholine cytidylyltransferase family protein [Methanobrevibacter sp.]
MICIILSAGMGRRLMPLTQDIPKPLLKINGMTLLERMIKNCIKAEIADFIVIAGYNAHKVHDSAELLEQKYGISITVFDNEDYADTNTSVSTYLASSYIERNNPDDFMLINGDNVVDPEIIAKIAKTANTAMVVDNFKTLNEESFKIIIENGTIKEIGKGIDIDSSTGEFIGISKVVKADIEAFNEILFQLIEQDKQNYYDLAFKPLSKETKIDYVFTDGCEWTEIDDSDDWQMAKRLVNEFENCH